ncbi:unnamed protein product [Prunus armeniaca]|uniref:DNA (cytosine-5-)-methyltransferase n=1 Tax=Prunus armeniaca TaxID=36596 RepID=A0A6J5UUJ2_PRUAR|nr:unnamed protein product [Prunus armeniaca]CAB4309494.1 unnamed protein product [Prunus armeniaca]
MEEDNVCFVMSIWLKWNENWLVPDYAFTYEQGKSKRPFARLWWDETVPTVLTFPTCHSQAILHPEQDRILTLRECARLQGFPDYYRFCGTVKESAHILSNELDIVKLEMQLQSPLHELWDMLWDWQFESSAGMNHS